VSARAPTLDGRVIIEAVSPQLDGGTTAVKRIEGEALTVTADIFSDGHDKIAAALLIRGPGDDEWLRVPMAFVDNDRWAGQFTLDRIGRWRFTIEAWRDPWASWLAEMGKKQAAGVPVTLETEEGLRLVEQAWTAAIREPDALRALVERLLAEEAGSPAQLAILLDGETGALLARAGERRDPSRYARELEVQADRIAARFSAWYEVFPRSQSGDPARHGTFDHVIAQLPYVRDLGFDVLYFTPIHPIGRTNRKGKNNSLKAGPGDPGSVYAIGGEEGGHDALHPELGTFDDFARLVEAARKHGLEIALDFAVQCSPDHPWIKQHPEWFQWRPDGSIRFAENPPKKYEDIVNVRFDGPALPGLWRELLRVVLFWAERGVRIFRVDNPHTKPIPFWAWLIAEVNERYPDVIFLAEAFTRPKMMKKLAKIGFQQSYTYFTWRNTKAELTDYALELAGDMGEYYRPNFFANTPDINPYYLQTSGRAGFVVRSTLAATLSSVYGIYQGFELCEATPVPGKEEYLDSEKYELKAWDLDRPGHIREHVAALNRIRRENPALHDFRNIAFLNAWNDQIIAYYKATPDLSNVVMVLVNLDPRNRQEATYEVPLWLFGLNDQASVDVEDLLAGWRFTLHGKTHRIAIDPAERSCVIWRLKRPGAAP
jgi:starch synthase (maltosyl-transferring)